MAAPYNKDVKLLSISAFILIYMLLVYYPFCNLCLEIEIEFVRNPSNGPTKRIGKHLQQNCNEAAT
jgi:hypothetical protein